MRPLSAAAGIAGFLAVALGAFGAHGLQGRLAGEALSWWQTATLYGLAHSVSALGLALHGHGRRRLLLAGWAFVAGTALFSGSLYAMALGAPRGLAMITPVGGVLFLVGWLLIAAHGLMRR